MCPVEELVELGEWKSFNRRITPIHRMATYTLNGLISTYSIEVHYSI